VGGEWEGGPALLLALNQLPLQLGVPAQQQNAL